MGVFSFTAEVFRLYPARFTAILVMLVLAAMLEIAGIATVLPVLAVIFGTDGEKAGTGLVSEWMEYLSIDDIGIGLLLVLLGLAMTVRTVFLALAGYVIAIVRIDIITGLRTRLMQALLDTDWGFHIGVKTGDVNNIIITQTENAGNAVHFLGKFFTGVIIGGIFLAASLSFSWQTVALSALLAGPVILLALQINRWSRVIARKLVNVSGECNQLVVENISLAKHIKASHLEANAGSRFERACGRWAALKNRDAVLFSLLLGVPESVVVLIVLGIFFYLYQNDPSDVENIILTILLLHRAASRLQSVQALHRNLITFIPGYEKCMELQDDSVRREERSGGTPFAGLRESIQFEKVRFGFNEGTLVLDEVSLAIPRGGMIALAGRSGSGKTTAVDILLGLHRPDSGRVVIDGEDSRNLDLFSLRERVSYVPQDPLLFSGTIRENIVRGLSAVDESAYYQALKTAHVEEFLRDLPDGDRSLVGERGQTLSGGQKQRIAIARALMRSPELLIMDEATSALDAASEDRIRQALHAMKGKITIILIAHRYTLIKEADRIYVLEQGRVVEQGNYGELMAGNGIFSQMSQMGSAVS